MKLYVILATLFSLLTFSCGVDLAGQKFKKEKDHRIENEQKLRAAENDAEIVRLLVSNLTQTATMQWAFVSNRLGEPFETYERAEKLCQSIAFELPTLEMLNAEGKLVPGIAAISFEDSRIEDQIYIKDSTERSLRYLVCSRSIPDGRK